MVARRKSRSILTVLVMVLLIIAFALAFSPRPEAVDIVLVQRQDMQLTINEEARTRVRDAYMVSAPIAGRLLRVEAEPGDPVIGGETIIARMLPINPSALDIRTREQGLAAVNAAEAALRMARADLNKAIADKELAEAEQQRIRQLHERGLVTRSELDRAVRGYRASQADHDTAIAAIAMREADLANARARLISFNDPLSPASSVTNSNTIPLVAPVSGRILRILQKSETTLEAGASILEIGDTAEDLEILAELLSSDAVRVSVGDPVFIDHWGGPERLTGQVEQVEPWGFTRFSALGVEEQRVNTIIRFTDDPDKRRALGHGYRVEVSIVVWQAHDVLTVPSAALFRHHGSWAVFVVDERQRVQLRQVSIGVNNGMNAQVLEGLTEHERVVIYPGPEVQEGRRVQDRTIF
ncbi:RND family efflux transporter MFP subunit [Methylophaga lonarensis MPL]|uniref:RND family efflux transporter MFP subunit n=1 Tax=Methylophaga lonarensis MPL TaxID=1286106 RepID=M7NZJ0_9GAMM|nr:HlyD family efflux transporter periplasmic adaptor subunit [Methylophaga lonarensis]EMR14248.1 RND family efflux transporter MFP subunit [Methylophaga lonarensis MPL]